MRNLVKLLLSLLLLVGSGSLWGQENEDCLMCHDDPLAVGTRDGSEIPVHVDPALFSQSVHGDFACIDCHAALEGVELPHEEDVDRVSCSLCHDDIGSEYAASAHGRQVGGAAAASCADCHGYHDVLSPSEAEALSHPNRTPLLCGKCHTTQARQHGRSLHGRAAARGDELAPNCVTCHRPHVVLPHSDPRSPTNSLNIPSLCGRCHREGAEVALQHDIPQTRILENYSQSIHGEGLFKKGLTVTAVCISCHTSHEILEHTHADSSIHRDNVAGTCTACHARIEEVHVQVIEGRLWAEERHKIPSCVECHSPHKIRRHPAQAGGAANQDCLACHSDPALTIIRDGKTVSLFVDEATRSLSEHAGVACAQCHSGVATSGERPCAEISAAVDCAICHAEQTQDYKASTHGRLAAEGDPDVPTCLDCHKKHATQSQRLPTAATYARNVPDLCGKCHRQGGKAAVRIAGAIPDIVAGYEQSVHGKGLLESGLVVSATCSNCHGPHRQLPAADPNSTTHPENVASTCGTCHRGIEEALESSIHWPGNGDTERELPTCEGCHSSHTIARTGDSDFRFKMMDQCGRCHTDEANTFFETYHGKVSRLGSAGAAKCYDCHGTHDILPTTDPDARLSRSNVVETCGQCHAGAHRRFAGYLTHATHHDSEKYPLLFYSFWAMTVLLIGTLSFALLHTGAWLWRLWRTREEWLAHKHTLTTQRLYLRFSRSQRIMHLIMLLSFFTLALTGMTLKFSCMGWATVMTALLGGFETMAVLHRTGAVVLIGLFIVHLWHLRRAWKESGKSLLRFIFAANSMMFNFTDIRQVWQSIKWFFGRGERPHYGRFTYWEKFDYFAVFWGVFVIGSTGLVLWFPELFTRILPGWSVNVATIIHSDEALLAVGFIFTIHFFNTHFRPDKFPMDPVIFTGRVALEELRHDKPAEYEDLIGEGTIEDVQDRLVDPFPTRAERAFKIFGFTALGIGLTLIFLICYSMLIGYR